MTREEAKHRLLNIERCTPIHTREDARDFEALEMAIQALSQEPCEDAIDRAEAMTEIMMFAGNVKPDEEDIYIKVSDAVQLLRELPSVTQKSGKWIWCVGSHKCSNCEEYTCFSHKELLKYCPNCGAKMVEPQESEDK